MAYAIMLTHSVAVVFNDFRLAMTVKKLAVPVVNAAIALQAATLVIATAAMVLF